MADFVPCEWHETLDAPHIESPNPLQRYCYQLAITVSPIPGDGPGWQMSQWIDPAFVDGRLARRRVVDIVAHSREIVGTSVLYGGEDD